MPRKTEVITARVTPEFKQALAVAAASEHRSQANMLEHLVLEYCRRQKLRGLKVQGTKCQEKK